VLTISTYRSWQGIDYETSDTTVAWNMLSKPFSSILACFNLLRSKHVTVNFATNCDSNSRPSRSYTSPTKGCVHECQMSPRVATNGKKTVCVRNRYLCPSTCSPGAKRVINSTWTLTIMRWPRRPVYIPVFRHQCLSGVGTICSLWGLGLLTVISFVYGSFILNLHCVSKKVHPFAFHNK